MSYYLINGFNIRLDRLSYMSFFEPNCLFTSFKIPRNFNSVFHKSNSECMTIEIYVVSNRKIFICHTIMKLII